MSVDGRETIHMEKIQLRNSLLLFLAAVIWGTTFVAQSVGMEYIGPLTYLCSRSFIGGVFLLCCLGVRKVIGKRKEEAEPGKTAFFTRQTLLGGAACGTVLFAASALQQIGIQTTDVGKAGFITTFYIVMVPVLGIFLGKKAGVRIWICVALALAGLYFLCMTGSFRMETADIQLFACAILFSVHILVIDHFIPNADGMAMSCVQFFVCGMISFVGMFLFEEPRMADILAGWFSVVYAGLLSSGVAYTLQIIGQKNMNPTVASLLMSLESVVSVLAGMVILHQILSGRELLGCVLMAAAVVLVQLPERKKGMA